MSAAMPRTTVWIVNPYGSLPWEPWTTYRSTMLAQSLEQHGFQVTQFISNFEHRSKTFRTATAETRRVSPAYTVRIVPGSGYDAHVSLRRIRHERTFARNLLRETAGEPPPDLVVLAEPALFYYDVLLSPLLSNGKSRLVLDVIDLWPELFALVIPRPLRRLAPLILSPFHYWRRRLYRHAGAVVAVAEDYLQVARRLASQPGTIFDVVYWGYREEDGDAPVPDDSVVGGLVRRKGSREKWIVYAGTLGENYDIAAILEAAGRFDRRAGAGGPVTFIVAGDGPLRALCERHARESFRFLGRLRGAELRVLYQHADVALCTYKGESTVAMPIKFFDYVRYGLPIVNSLGRDVRELVERHRLGLNYEPGSADSLHRALATLIDDDRLRQQCAEHARRLAPTFRSDIQYAKFVEVLRRLAPA